MTRNAIIGRPDKPFHKPECVCVVCEGWIAVNPLHSNDLPARVLAMCKARNWSLHWTARGAYLHLESSELIEAIRGKHGDPMKEAADVLLVLMSITEANGIPWDDVVQQTELRTAELMATASTPYAGESRA